VVARVLSKSSGVTLRALVAGRTLGEDGEKEPEEFDHRRRIADRCHLAG
jgi:hypothetical protein